MAAVHRSVIWPGPGRVRARAESHDGSGCVLALDVLVADGRARIHPLGWVRDDPGLVDQVCEWLRRQGVDRAVLEVDDDHEADGTGFTKGEQHLRYERTLPLLDVDTAGASWRPAVREVTADDPDVAALAASLLRGSAQGRPSGAELLAALRHVPGIRAWAAGPTPTAAYVTRMAGTTCHVAVAAHAPGAPAGLLSALVEAAAEAARADGATQLTATVAAHNLASHRLCERLGLRAVRTVHWWCRDLRVQH